MVPVGRWALITAAVVAAVSQQSVLMRASACNEAVSVGARGHGYDPPGVLIGDTDISVS